MEENNTERVVPVFGKINYETITKIMNEVLGHWRKDPNGEIKLIICSGGGMTDPTFMFIDMIKMYGINLTTIGSGGVGSMAVLLFAAGKKRFVTKHTDLFLHDLGCTMEKELRLTVTELEKKHENLRVSQNWYAEFIQERTSGNFKREDVLRRMKSEEYLYPDELVELGLAHEII